MAITIEEERANWQALQQRMQMAYVMLSKPEDPIAQGLQTLVDQPTRFRARADELLQQADEAIAAKQEEVEQARVVYHNEEKKVAAVQAKVKTLQARKDQLVQESAQLLDNVQHIQQETARIDEESAKVDLNEQPVPTEKLHALRQQISLYANCSGIKWDFSSDDPYALRGEMVYI